MLQIGVTGGIGSGKTTICKVFEFLGIPVFNADLVARQLTNEDPLVREAIRDTFGKEMYDENGKLNRQKMAGLVFEDPLQLEKLNHIIHPAVGRAYKAWVDAQAPVPYVIKEAAILFESGSAAGLDKVIVVTAPEALRVNRVVKRDHTTEQEVKNRMARQLSEEERIERADFVINNDEEQALIPQVMEIHQKLLAL